MNPNNFKRKDIDIGLSILFLIYFSYYTFLGFVWGGMSGDKYMPYVLTAFIGLIFILVSVVTNSKKVFIVTRIVGLFLFPFLIFEDKRHSFIFFDTKWSFIKNILNYTPAKIFLLFCFYSLVRLYSVIRQKRV